MYCPHCGTENPADAQFCAHCGQPLNAGGTAVGTAPEPTPSVWPRAAAAPTEYAGFWRRFAALFIDGIILSVPTGFINMILGLSTFPFFGRDSGVDPDLAVGAMVVGMFWSYLLGAVIGWIYYAWFESSTFQATPGKLTLGILVTDTEGRRISFARATGRHFAKFLSAAILLVGYLMAAFTERKQALHDMIADTLVVRK